MPIPLEIDFRNIERTEALESALRKKVDKLEHFCDRITSCHVTLEAPHQHHHKGKRYQVHIRLSVPGKLLAVSHESGEQSHEDAYVAIRDAFSAARRQLEDHVRIMRGDTKAARRRARRGENEG
ncbi:MAG TPA: HPF/RaiA family ribosome-associated protein [Gammaproteobacteria bacterium]|nr:HPF/RaiA family ribosome-associated protein [Gammaproteobacteria bacterium]